MYLAEAVLSVTLAGTHHTRQHVSQHRVAPHHTCREFMQDTVAELYMGLHARVVHVQCIAITNFKHVGTLF